MKYSCNSPFSGPHPTTLAVLLTVAVLCLATVGMALADDYGKRKHKGQGTVPPNTAYEQACGACHMAYPPMLLPAASWRSLVPDSGEHFGDRLPLSAAELQSLRTWLTTHAADNSSSKRARKIMESLGGQNPQRVSEVPYIQRKHRKVDPTVFARPAVGGLANCAACHPGARSGDFRDDDVRIPQ